MYLSKTSPEVTPHLLKICYKQRVLHPQGAENAPSLLESIFGSLRVLGDCRHRDEAERNRGAGLVARVRLPTPR
jgi:hypothetical protein